MVSGIPLKFAAEITSIHNSLNCINDVITTTLGGTYFEDKWQEIFDSKLNDVSEKFAECYGNGAETDLYNCVLAYAFEVNEIIENFVEYIKSVSILGR